MKKQVHLKIRWLVLMTLVLMVAGTGTQAKSVYFISEFDLDLIRNSVLSDLLTDGLSFKDSDGNDVFIPGLGFEVTLVNQADDDPNEALNYDLVFAPESVASGDVAMYGDKPIPYLTAENALVRGRVARDGALWFGTADNGTPGDFEFEIIDNTHPITSIFEQGQFIAVTTNDIDAELGGVPVDDIAPGVTVLAQAGGFGFGPLRYTLIVADKGTTGLAGSDPIPPGFEPTPERRAYLGYHIKTVEFGGTDNLTDPVDITITKDAAILFQRLVQWLVGDPVTADGTPEGAQLPEVSVGDWSIY